MTLKKLKLKTKIILVLLPFTLISFAYIFSAANPSKHPPGSPDTTTPIPDIPQLLYSDPPAGILNSFWTTTAIEFKFTQAMNVYSIKYTVDPPIETLVAPSVDQKSVYIRPKNGWEFDKVYLIKINSISSVANLNILSPITYSFKLVQPTDVISQ